MKALVLTEFRKVAIDQRPRPVPGPDEVLLKVRGTGICGSDVAGFLGLQPRRQPGLVLGHETVGVVEQMPSTGPAGGEWPYRTGQRVVVNPLMPCGTCPACLVGDTNICVDWRLLGMDRIPGAFAEYVTVPARNVFPLPDDLPDNRAVMIEPLANGVHLFRLIARHNFGSIAFFGAGTQGCLMLTLARLLGYREIAMVDINPSRLEVAKGLGAKYLIHAGETDPAAALKKVFGGTGPDVVVDAHGDQKTRAACIESARKGGEILLLGLHEVNSTVDFAAIVRKELRVQGSYAFNAADYTRSKALIESGDVDLSAWTESMPLEEGQTAFDKLITGPGSTMKFFLTI